MIIKYLNVIFLTLNSAITAHFQLDKLVLRHVSLTEIQYRIRIFSCYSFSEDYDVLARIDAYIGLYMYMKNS